MKRTSWTILALCLMAPLIPACDGGSGSAGVTAGTGHLSIHLTDAPIDLSTVRSVIVTIDGVTVYGGRLLNGDDIPPRDLMTHPETFDLLTLTGGATTLLAEGDLSAGMYNRIRLHVSSASLEFLDGTTAPLKIESNKVDVPIPFEVGVDAFEEITLDFQADASVHVNETGNDKYILRPVVTPVRDGGNGSD